MYSRSNREITAMKVKTAATAADMDDVEIMKKAIALVRANKTEHRDLIERMAATIQSLPGRQQFPGCNEGLMTYGDRPQAIAKTVLNELRYKQR